MKSRFCPSPTGHIHLGNVRTALFNALLAKKMGGVFLLRIEDTDKARSKSEYIQSLLQDLIWLGLHWQEGPEVGGEHGPYSQSERQRIYDRYYDQLIQQGQAYPCFCSEQTLAINRKIQLSTGQPPRYPGTCRMLMSEQIAENRAKGLPESLRFLIPKHTLIQFTDFVKGPQTFKSDDIGDFIIRRQDGSPSFMFSNAIDDSLMGVTHALRGDDHLTNTPKQLLILQALQLRTPGYGHLSLILGHDGAPLSKRNGSRSVMEVREQGYLPLAVVNYLARLGHRYDHNNFFTFDELARDFSEKNLSLSPARFDIDHLNYWQREALLHLPLDDLIDWCREPVSLPDEKLSTLLDVVRRNILFPNDVKVWADVILGDVLVYDVPAVETIKEAGPAFFEAAIQAVKSVGCDFHLFHKIISDETGRKGKSLFLPLRMALTGRQFGPEMGPLCNLMGPTQLINRFTKAYDVNYL